VSKISSPSSLSYQTQYLWRRDDQTPFQYFTPFPKI
jgi:hypothetical protein